MDSPFVIYVSDRSGDELTGFKVNGNITLVRGLCEGEAYQDILRRHGVDTNVDYPEGTIIGDISKVRPEDLMALMTESRDFLVDLGIKCGPIYKQSIDEWHKAIDSDV